MIGRSFVPFKFVNEIDALQSQTNQPWSINTQTCKDYLGETKRRQIWDHWCVLVRICIDYMRHKQIAQ